SLGHPATSRSPVMDYVLADETRLIAASRFSERAVPLPRGCLRFRMPGSGLTLPARAAPLPADGVVRIAIPSVAQKLTADFVDALRQVERACGVGVRFVFFTGCRGALYGSAVQNLRK